VHDGTGYIEAAWFQPYLEKRFRVGAGTGHQCRVEEYLGRLLFTGPEWELLQRDLLNTARLCQPIPLPKGWHSLAAPRNQERPRCVGSLDQRSPALARCCRPWIS